MEDYRYANPPLVEVVVEIHWRITPLQAGPGMAIDPHYAAFAPAMADRLKDAGFVISEELKPAPLPIEFFGNVVATRHRKSPNAWPVIQVGPGVLTINMVPPYEGWKSFREIVGAALGHLFTSYPLAERYLNIASVQLRYIDAFGSKHGFTGQFGKFLKENFEISIGLPNRIVDSAEAKDAIESLLEVRVPLRNPAASVGIVKVAPGIVGEQVAMVAEFSVTVSADGAVPREPVAILNWLDSAHSVVRDWFISTPRPQLLETFGEKIQV